MIWDRLIECKDKIISILDRDCEEYNEDGMEKFNKETWTNRTWKNVNVRRAHFEIVDARDTRGHYMLHLSHAKESSTYPYDNENRIHYKNPELLS